MRRIVITGMGIISPVGNSVPVFWNNLKAGVCGVEPIRSFDTSDLSVKVAAQVKDFNPADHGIDAATARKADLYTLYALAAARQAMKESNPEMDPERLGVYVGSGIGGIHTFISECKKYFESGPNRVSPLFIPTMISNIAAGNIAIAYNAQGPCLPVVTACATSTHAIGEAFLAIRHGYADAIIAGGSEAAIVPLAVGGFNNSRALSRAEDPAKASIPFDAQRQGFVMGEGAGIVVLEEYHRAVNRGAVIYAEVTGYGNTCDAFHYTAPRPDGSTAARAMQRALSDSGYIPGEMIYINAHGTSTPLNDPTETMAIKLALGEEQARKALISSTKSMTGHMLGAAGAAEIIAAALALKEGIVPPTIGLEHPDPQCDLDYVPGKARKAEISIALSNSLGFGGHNATVALRKFKA
ncbi:MAG: beta-ketoacyl-ACP synthase II [Bacteroidales bacterium]|nr:beta-ketoacyl-ACP synthase II [Bacteroidales bacterium]MDD2824757.1 beta-ketoacyl-ACP synthase II [Bacteroidales bacterium]MDD3639521.1 beta-ketoacyl-ACP synthase II [Bacteroidales bacterium]MDD3944217.1 beta-ketoacyl-ACP synthase II [Bacteroidales bacterium]MDD4481336.1 beta-ketoacyl-ACP synthase II [Bacteroidales bacterium]